MQLIDYNGRGRWALKHVMARYKAFADELRIKPRDISPLEHSEGQRHWVYPVMDKIIEGIEQGDAACILIGIEFIEEDSKFPFGKILKSNTARALRRADLSEEHKIRIRKRVFAMLRAGHVPHEFREYAKLVREIGFDTSEIGEVRGTSERVTHFRTYFEAMARRNPENSNNDDPSPTPI